jgi:TPR repeat protein
MVTVTVFFLCCQAYAGQAKNSSQFKLKNETESLMTDTYSPEIKLMNLNNDELFRTAMNGSPEDQFQAALLFGQGQEVKRDFVKCIQLLEKAAKGGNVTASFLLGTIYLKGGSVFEEVKTEVEYGGILIPAEFPYDTTLAFHYFLASGDGGDALSRDGCFIIKKQILDAGEYTEAAKKMLHSLEAFAKTGNALALRFLAELYSEGKLVRQDDQIAFNLFKESAEHGDGWGQYNTARKYISGLGVERDTKKGFEWMKKAAENNLPIAQFDLAVLYYLGTGTSIDKQLGYVWLLIAKENGHEEAENLVKEADKEGLTKEEKKAARDLAAKLLKQLSAPKESGRLLAALNSN